MSDDKTQSTGKILGRTKLSRENHKAFFEALDYWAIQRKLKRIYSDDDKSVVRRLGSLDTDEIEMGNATVMSLLMNQLSEEDLVIISGIVRVWHPKRTWLTASMLITGYEAATLTRVFVW